jgi:hypothetical protein
MNNFSGKNNFLFYLPHCRFQRMGSGRATYYYSTVAASMDIFRRALWEQFEGVCTLVRESIFEYKTLTEIFKKEN